MYNKVKDKGIKRFPSYKKGEFKMKKFINDRFNEAIACAGAKIREDHYEYVESIFDEITPYGWESHCADGHRMEEENTSDVLRRHYGRIGSHDRVFGFCFNPTKLEV
jgi:hypothetical protein